MGMVSVALLAKVPVGFFGLRFLGLFNKLKSGKVPNLVFFAFVNFHNFFSPKTVSLSCFQVSLTKSAILSCLNLPYVFKSPLSVSSSSRAHLKEFYDT